MMSPFALRRSLSIKFKTPGVSCGCRGAPGVHTYELTCVNSAKSLPLRFVWKVLNES
jgi:hypothetical protein